MARSTGVTVSAVLVFIGSVFTLLSGALVIVGAFFVSHMPGAPRTPVNTGAVLAVESLIFLGFGSWGVATGIGLLNLKQWARISMIVFAAILVFICVPSAVIMAVIPLPKMTAPDLPENFMSVMRVGMVAFYTPFALLGGFWLYFFNRKGVRNQFQAQRPLVESTITGVTTGTSTVTPVVRRARPLSITIIGWFLLVSSVFAAISLPLTRQVLSGAELPMYFLGHFFFGRAAYAVLIMWALATAGAAVGLLKLKRAGLIATIALQCLAIINVTMLAAIPGARSRFQHLMDTMMATMNANMAGLAVTSGNTAAGVPLIRFPVWASVVTWVPLVLVILWFLITRRHAFRSDENDLAARRP